MCSLKGKHPCSGGCYGTSPTNLSLFKVLRSLIAEVGNPRFLQRFFYWCASKSTKCTSYIFLVTTHWYLFISSKASMLHDPCALVFFLPKNTLVLHICNGALVRLIDHCALTLVLPFAMGASTIGALYGNDAPMLFVIFWEHRWAMTYVN